MTTETEQVGVVALASQPEETDLWWARRLRAGLLLPVERMIVIPSVS